MYDDIDSLLAFPRPDIGRNKTTISTVNSNFKPFNPLISSYSNSTIPPPVDINIHKVQEHQIAPLLPRAPIQNVQNQQYNTNTPIFSGEPIQTNNKLSPPVSQQTVHTQPRAKRRRDRENEIARVQQRVSGFDFLCSDAWTYLCRHFGNKVTQEELVSIADAIKPYARVKLDRDARRRKSVILKWYQDNWPQIQQYIKYVVLEDDSPSSP